jgi:hypothetical protein
MRSFKEDIAMNSILRRRSTIVITTGRCQVSVARLVPRTWAATGLVASTG